MPEPIPLKDHDTEKRLVNKRLIACALLVLAISCTLIAAGIVTTVPLLCFTAAATRLRLSTLGFFQYIGPTLMFLLAVTFYGEKPGADKMVTFAFIWVALAIFVMDAIYTQRRTSK